MKVKKILLSMCAIAALASCSQNDDVVPAGAGGEEARVVLKLEGDAVEQEPMCQLLKKVPKLRILLYSFLIRQGLLWVLPNT